MKQKLELRLLGEVSITSYMQMTLLFFDRKQKGSKEPLDEVKEGVKKKKMA